MSKKIYLVGQDKVCYHVFLLISIYYLSKKKKG